MKASKNLTKKVLNYAVVFEAAEEGGYIARVPSLPGCMTQGETLKEATKNIIDAIGGYVAVMNETQNEATKISVANSVALVV